MIPASADMSVGSQVRLRPTPDEARFDVMYGSTNHSNGNRGYPGNEVVEAMRTRYQSTVGGSEPKITPPFVLSIKGRNDRPSRKQDWPLAALDYLRSLLGQESVEITRE